jgi:hypothetical protein
MVWAEQKALEHYEKPEELRDKPPVNYLNAKKINYEPPGETWVIYTNSTVSSYTNFGI